MDPLTACLMRSSKKAVAIASSTIWQVTQDTSVTLSGISYTASGLSQGRAVSSNALPALTTTGWYIDVNLLGGHPSQVAWLGIANTQSVFTSRANYTGWYWSGSIYTPDAQTTSIGEALVAGSYRIAAKIDGAGLPFIYYRGLSGIVRGPYALPQTVSFPSVYLMVMGQSGYAMPSGQFANGIVFEGGGGLF